MTFRRRIVEFSLALFLSAVACGLLFIALNAAVQVWRGREPRIAVMIPFALLMMSVVALSAALVQWPVLRLIRSLKRPFVIAFGTLLAVVPFAILILLLREDDETLSGLLRFWRWVPGEFLIGFIPMAVAGGVLGWFASLPERSAAEAQVR